MAKHVFEKLLLAAIAIQSAGTGVQASAAVREFETKDSVRVFLLPHKVGASGLTLNRGTSPLSPLAQHDKRQMAVQQFMCSRWRR